MFSLKKYKGEFALASFPAVGFVAASATAKVIAQYGHSFIQVGPQSSLIFGVIGAVNNCASFILTLLIEKSFAEGKYLDRGTKGLMAANVIVVTVLVGLSALAAKVNLISSGITLAGGAVLIVTGFAGNFLLFNAWS